MIPVMKRSFNFPPAREILSRGHSYGGSYRLDKSTEAILEARRRKRAARSDPAGFTQVLLETLALATSVALAVFLLLWVVCSGNEPEASSWAFCASLWAFAALMGICGVILLFNLFRRS